VRRARGWRPAAVAAGLLALAGCVPETTPLLREDVDRLRTDLLRIDQTIQRLQAEVKAEIQRADRQSSQGLTEIQRSIAQLGARLDELGRDTGLIQGRLDEVRRRLDAIALQLDVGGIPAGSAPGARPAPAPPSAASGAPSTPVRPAPSPAPPGPPAPAAGQPADLQGAAREATELYQTAYLDYTRGNYPLAIAAFREVIRRYPRVDLAERAQFWIGESHFSLARSLQSRGESGRATQEFERAVQEFRRVLIEYPRGEMVPSALLKRALTLLELKQPALAEADLKFLVDQYPAHEEAAKAREMLGVRP
jgi:TolA-binding protein